MQKTKGFTLIELLIVIAIIAVLAVVVVLTLNPAELLRQARDSTRLSDIASINGALAFYLADIPQGFAVSGNGSGSLSNRCFAYPTSTDGCTAMGFAATPDGNSTSTGSRSIDGNGWIPLNFSDVSTGSPFGILPVDPVSATSSANPLYYRAAFTTTTYKIIAVMESDKFSNGGGSDVESTDGGQNADLFEAGSNLAL